MITQLRHSLISSNSDFLNNKSYVEFGVYRGTSMIEIYNLYNKLLCPCNSNFYGFDAFLGLPPEPTDMNNPTYWTKERPNCLDFNLRGIIPPILQNKPNLTIISGWFKEVLTHQFAMSLNQKIGLLHIDCDIYSSAYEALDFCFKYNLIESGTIIMYDDWAGYWEKVGENGDFLVGEGLAHKQIMDKYNKECKSFTKHIILPQAYEIAVFIVK